MSKAWPKGRAQRRARLFQQQLLNTRKARGTFHMLEDGQMPPTITDLISVPVHGHTLFVADDRLPLVPLRPICDALGIDWRSQQAKVMKHPTFAPTVVEITTVAGDGKLRRMSAMPADMVMLWMGGINPDRVAASVRDTLIAFQRTAARLLHDAWAAARAGLPLTLPQGDLFAAAPAQSWLSHPAVRDAVLLRRQAEAVRAAASGEARHLLRASLARVKHLGLKASHLDMLTAITTLPPVPAQPSLPLVAEG